MKSDLSIHLKFFCEQVFAFLQEATEGNLLLLTYIGKNSAMLEGFPVANSKVVSIHLLLKFQHLSSRCWRRKLLIEIMKVGFTPKLLWKKHPAKRIPILSVEVDEHVGTSWSIEFAFSKPETEVKESIFRTRVSNEKYSFRLFISCL